MTKKERIELAKIGVLTGEDAKRFNEAIANPKKVSAEEIARIKESASRIIDKTNPRVNELKMELSLITEKYQKLELMSQRLINMHSKHEEKYNKLKEAFLQLSQSYHVGYYTKKSKESSIEKWMIKAGLKEQ